MKIPTINVSSRALALFSVIAFIALLNGVGCQGISGQSTGKIAVQPSSVLFPYVPFGTEHNVNVRLSNIGKGTLTIYKYAFVPDTGGSIKGISTSGLPASGTDISIESGKTLDFQVVFHSDVGTPSPSGVLRLYTSDVSQKAFATGGGVEIPIRSIKGSSLLDVSPNPLRFKRSLGGGSVVDTRKVVIRNNGVVPIVINQLPDIQSVNNDFAISGSSFGNRAATQSRFSSATPVVLLPYDDVKAAIHPNDYQIEFTIRYDASATGSGVGQFVLNYNDLGDTKAKKEVVSLEASTTGPCLYVYPVQRDFGQVPVGSKKETSFVITNCGTEDLDISQLSITSNTPDNEFKLETTTIPSSIAPGDDSPPIELSYSPVQEGYDSGTLTIESNDPTQSRLSMPLLARGTVGACPVVQSGGYVEGGTPTLSTTVTAAPLDYVVLDASHSTDSDGRVVAYQWKVLSAPVGGTKVLEPLDTDPNDKDLSRRRYRPLVAGKYEIEVSVVDNEGFESCVPQVITIIVQPKKRIHIELTWTNPADPDETDQIGSDVDLHMVKMGTSTDNEWFGKYDLYYKVWETLNRQHKKFAEWNPEHPTLDIDDRDGGGPENIQLDNPENCGWYAVGVHYFKKDFGTAYASIKIYIDQKMVFEDTGIVLSEQGDFTDVARIYWSGNASVPGQIFEVNKHYSSADLDKIKKMPPAMIPEMSPPLCSAQHLF